jgi:non-heme chloroperoxidase
MKSKLAAVTTLLLALCARPAKPATKDGFVTMTDGAKIHYLEAGQGPALVFIPGWTMPAEIWEPQVAHFSKAHRVIAFDPRSQGQSSKTGDGSFPGGRAYDLKEVLEKLEIPSATLVCWSMAVSECIAYVELYGTGRVASLVLVDGYAGAPFDDKRLAGTLRFVSQLQRNRTPMTDSFVRSMFKKPQSEEYIKRLVEASLKTPTDTAVALFVGTLEWDSSEAFARIDKPTLIAVTESPFLEGYKKMGQQIRGSRLEVFQSGHALFVDEAEKFNQLLDGFLAAPSPQGSGQ